MFFWLRPGFVLSKAHAKAQRREEASF